MGCSGNGSGAVDQISSTRSSKRCSVLAWKPCKYGVQCSLSGEKLFGGELGFYFGVIILF